MCGFVGFYSKDVRDENVIIKVPIPTTPPIKYPIITSKKSEITLTVLWELFPIVELFLSDI